MTPDKVDEVVSRRLGIPIARVRNVHRALREAEIISPGAPGRSPETEPADVAMIVLALGTGAPLSKMARTLAEYVDCTPGGADMAGAPAHLPPTAGIALELLAEEAAEGRDIGSFRLEVVQQFPEVRLRHADGSVQRFQRQGALTGHPETKDWAAVTFTSAAIAAIMRELFA